MDSVALQGGFCGHFKSVCSGLSSRYVCIEQLKVFLFYDTNFDVLTCLIYRQCNIMANGIMMVFIVSFYVCLLTFILYFKLFF